MSHKEIQAIINTFYYQNASRVRGICPECGEYMIIDGYVCFGCGHDITAKHYTPEE